MKVARVAEFDATDRAILELLQQNCKQPLTAIGEKVGLSAPSVVERIHKLEEAGVITSYVALVDARRLGKDPDLWADLSQVLPLLAEKKYYKTLRYGYARGYEPVRYVTRIRDYEDILVQELGITGP